MHRAEDAVDPEPGMPEAGVVSVHFVFGPRGSTVSERQRRRSITSGFSSLSLRTRVLSVRAVKLARFQPSTTVLMPARHFSRLSSVSLTAQVDLES